MLEADAIPGLTETSLLPQAADAAGIGFDELIGRIVEAARTPAPSAGALTPPAPGATATSPIPQQPRGATQRDTIKSPLDGSRSSKWASNMPARRAD